MALISTLKQLHQNLETVENYLIDGNEDEQFRMRELIRRGRSFVAYSVNNEMRFAPSRFCGYVNNTLLKHIKNDQKHGWDTNKTISKILHSAPLSDAALEKSYISYCSFMGVEPSNYERRRYWHMDLDEDFEINANVSGDFKEGRLVERRHLVRERNSKVVQVVKQNFKKKNKTLFCEACGFDFEKVYGKAGADYIEAHHIIPVSQMQENHISKPEDFILLCSNCHKITHRRRPWLTLSGLKNLMKNK